MDSSDDSEERKGSLQILAQIWSKTVGYFMPPGGDEHPLAAQQHARQAVSVALLVSGLAALLSLVTLRNGQSLSTGLLLFCSLANAIGLQLFHRRGHIQSGIHLTVGCAFVCTLVVAWFGGGLRAPAVVLIPCVGIAMVFLSGFRSGLLWSGVSVAALLLLYVAHQLGWVPEPGGTPERRLLMHLVDPIVMIMGLLALARIVSDAKQRLLTTVEKRSADAQWRNQALEKMHQESERIAQAAIRSRREADAAREYAERVDAQKTHFFENVSHEIRTHLTLLTGPLAELRRDLPDSLLLATMERGSHRLVQVVTQLLEYQKLSSGQREVNLTHIDVGDFLQRTMFASRSAASLRQISLRLETPLGEGPSLIARGEFDGLETILFNFISNALKYTPPGGQVVLGHQQMEDRVRLFVRDSGPGVPEQMRERLFRVFDRLDRGRGEEGTGLGLALTRELAGVMRGSVGMHPAKQRGSVFWCELELAESDAEPAKREALEPPRNLLLREEVAAMGLAAPDDLSAGEEADLDAPCVMVVDDMPAMARLTARMLHRQGYRVVTCHSGQEALDVAYESPPDLLITDWIMPDMDGGELRSRLRDDRDLATIPAIVLTARYGESARREASRCGAEAFLGKPCDEHELTSMVQNLLRLKTKEREVSRLNRQLMEQGLQRFLPADLARSILDEGQVLAHLPRPIPCSILVSSLFGLDMALDKVSNDIASELLGQHVTELVDTVFEHGGTISRLTGDGSVVLFGIDQQMAPEVQMSRALACAQAIQEVGQLIGPGWQDAGTVPPRTRCALHHGEAIVGMFGNNQRSEYMAIGASVTFAEQLQRACPPEQTWLSQSAAKLLPSSALVEVGPYRGATSAAREEIVYRPADDQDARGVA